MSRVNVAVAVDARGYIYEVAAACRALGLDHTATLTVVGVLTGSVELDNLAKLWGVSSGVVAVEVESAFPIANPGEGPVPRARKLNWNPSAMLGCCSFKERTGR